MIAVPPNGGYWLEASESKRPDPRSWISKEDCDKAAKTYGDQFKDQNHQAWMNIFQNIQIFFKIFEYSSKENERFFKKIKYS